MTQTEFEDIKSFYGVYGTLAPGMADKLFQAVVVTDAVAAEPAPEPVAAAKPKRAAKAVE